MKGAGLSHSPSPVPPSSNLLTKFLIPPGLESREEVRCGPAESRLWALWGLLVFQAGSSSQRFREFFWNLPCCWGPLTKHSLCVLQLIAHSICSPEESSNTLTSLWWGFFTLPESSAYYHRTITSAEVIHTSWNVSARAYVTITWINK